MIFPIYFCSREVFPPVWCRYWWGGGGLSQWPSTRRQPSLGWSAATFSVSDFTRKQFSTRYVLYCSYWTLNVDLTYTVQYPYQNALEHGTYNAMAGMWVFVKWCLFMMEWCTYCDELRGAHDPCWDPWVLLMAVMVTALTRACPHIASPDFANAKLLSIILLFALGQAACAFGIW